MFPDRLLAAVAARLLLLELPRCRAPSIVMIYFSSAAKAMRGFGEGELGGCSALWFIKFRFQDSRIVWARGKQIVKYVSEFAGMGCDGTEMRAGDVSAMNPRG
jgi:hypothetical protein